MFKKPFVALAIACAMACTGTAFAQICADQVPTLGGNSPAVSRSGIYSSGYQAFKAFDSSTSSMWISRVWQTPAWIAYDFGVGKVIHKYTILNTNGNHLTSRAPKDFSLQGWSNGIGWVTIDTRTNQTGWVSGVPRSFNVANPGNYSKYRLHITDDNDIRSGIVVISMGDLKLETCQILPCR